MDGRWSLRFAAGVLGGLVGCASTQTTPNPPILMGKDSVPVTAAPPKPKASPTMYVSMGRMSDEIAEDADRSPQERESARQQARQSYQKAIDLDAKFAPAYVALGKSFALTGDRERAQSFFQKAQTLAPKDATIPLEQGVCLARVKDWDAAIECLSRSAQMDPDNKQCQKWLGLTLARAGHYDEGLAALGRCMPEAEARYNLARMLQHNQQPAAAEQQLQFALRADPNYEPARALLAPTEPGANTVVRTTSYTEPAPAAPANAGPPPVTLGGR